jgi:GT2 family glycosyltransferase
LQERELLNVKQDFSQPISILARGAHLMEIFAIVVRYKLPLCESQTMQGLTHAFQVHPELRRDITVLVWDNSPGPLDENPALPFRYIHSKQNIGVAGAYNRGVELAESMHCSWLLLLDQDTTIPADFLPKMLDYSRRLSDQREIAVIAPILLCGEKVSSPSIVRFGHAKLLKPDFHGTSSSMIIPLNSGMLMRISSLKEIGGFNEDFWLDFSDVVVQTLLHRRGKRIYVAGDIHLPHETTIDDLEHAMSPARYRNLLSAEGAFWDIYRSPPLRMLYSTRLLLRTLKQYARFQNKSFPRLTLSYFLHRLFSSRKQRLERWRQQSQFRDIPAISWKE